MARTAEEELDIYLQKLLRGARYYVRCLRAATGILITLRLTAFLLPVVVAILLSLSKDGEIAQVRGWLISLSIIGSACTLLLSQLRFDEFIALQEDYRREFDYLADEGRMHRNTGTTTASSIHNELLSRAKKFEEQYPERLKSVVGSFFQRQEVASRPYTGESRVPSLTKCRTCSREVSSSASLCPGCGEQFPGVDLKCPECGSSNVSVGQKGFSVGKAAAGAVLLGPAGALGGLWVGKKVECVCQKCGFRGPTDKIKG